MLINISDIPEVGLEEEVELPVAVSDDSDPVTAKVRIRIIKVEKRLIVQGAVKISAALVCSRCLGEYSYPLDLSFTEEYKPVADKDDEVEHELSEEELGLDYYKDDEINVSDMVKEQVLLSIPMKPLCGENCKGICSVCGINLNESSCGCAKDRIDPRLSPLMKLKEKMNQQDG